MSFDKNTSSASRTMPCAITFTVDVGEEYKDGETTKVGVELVNCSHRNIAEIFLPAMMSQAYDVMRQSGASHNCVVEHMQKVLAATTDSDREQFDKTVDDEAFPALCALIEKMKAPSNMADTDVFVKTIAKAIDDVVSIRQAAKQKKNPSPFYEIDNCNCSACLKARETRPLGASPLRSEKRCKCEDSQAKKE